MRRGGKTFRIEGTIPNAAIAASLDLSHLILNSPAFPYAACANRDPDLWSEKVAIRNGINLTEEGRQAVNICGRCAHITACLQWALDTDERHGILGGLTPAQRRKLHK